MNGDKLMVVSMRHTPGGLAVGEPYLLFEGDYAFAGTVPNFDVAPDDQSFVMIRGERRKPWTRIQVVLHWFEDLKDRATGVP